MRGVEEVGRRAQRSDLVRSEARNRIRVVGGSMGIYYRGDLLYTFYEADVSAQYLHLQISTFDKSSIPTLAHSHMEIASLSFPLYSYPPYDLTIKTNKDKNKKTSFRYSRVVLRQPRQTTNVTIRCWEYLFDP